VSISFSYSCGYLGHRGCRVEPQRGPGVTPARRDGRAGGCCARGAVVVRGRADLDGGGGTVQVRLDSQERSTGVADEVADVPLTQARLVPAVTYQRGRTYEPLGGVGEGAT
jgi:hypothetical protein